MAQIFQISDGTTTIDLLSPTGNYHLAKWESGISQWKNGGIFSENPLIDGRTPIDRAFDSVQEKITIHITGSSQDNVISSLRSLVRLLDGGFLYFSENTGTPTYLIVKSDSETNTRYSVITSYSIDKLPEQFDGPFLVGGKQFAGNLSYSAIYVEIELIIERDHWLNAAPGTSVSNSIQNQYTYNSKTYGQNSTSSDYVFVSSQRCEANITHIYRFDNSASSWSSNLLGSTPPYNLLPSSTTANDAIYFGIQSSLSNSGPFHNLIFNIGTPASGITGVWELGSGGSTLYGADGTQTTPFFGSLSGQNSFTQSGLCEISFADYADLFIPFNLQTVFGGSAPNVTGYWIRFKVTSVSSPIVPTQAAGSVDIFTCTRPYIDINSASITGDIKASSKITVKGRAGRKKLGPSGYLTASSMVIGARKYSRGSLFTSYLNASDTQNPSGITLTSTATIATFSNCPSGKNVIDLSTTNGQTYTITWSLNSTIAKHYFGTYRIYVRSMAELASYGKSLKLTLRSGESDLYSTDYVSVTNVSTTTELLVGDMVITDMGLINIPYSGILSNSLTVDIINNFDIILTVKNTGSTTGTGRIIDLVLIPADESIVEIKEILYSNTATSGITYNRRLEVDNITMPARAARALLIDTATSNIVSVYRLINTNGIEIPTERSFLWFLYFDRYINASNPSDEFMIASPENNVFGLKISTANRYLLPRGNN